MQLRPRTAGPILIVEDSDEDHAALAWAMRKLELHHETVRCRDGDEALRWLRRTGEHAARPEGNPGLVLLDLNLTATDGCEVLAEIKKDPGLRTIPVVVWTTSSNPVDVHRCYHSGANSYVLKPLDMDTFLHEVQALARYWFGVVMLPTEVDR
ncbi:MAG TPA: response regulator [Longimicrobiaceae bacterium]|jgi:CheY-like chemotaxis protein|nr:response regulator [Longimicrobiaceae bacterium]